MLKHKALERLLSKMIN